MASFEGFQPGCPGIVRISPPMHSGPAAWFESDGVPLEGPPTAIRVLFQDDYESSMYQDTILAFGEDASNAQVGRNDRHVIPNGVITLGDSDIEQLSALCASCDSTETDTCPVLEGVLSGEVLAMPALAKYIESYKTTRDYLASERGQSYLRRATNR